MRILTFCCFPLFFQGCWKINQYPNIKVTIYPNSIEAYSSLEGNFKAEIENIIINTDSKISLKLKNFKFDKNKEFKDYLSLLKINNYIHLLNFNKESLNIEFNYLNAENIIINYKYSIIYDGQIHLIQL
jgi:hypothetical protein